MSKKISYELRIKASGARIRLKTINSAKYKFWSQKSESDLLDYLQSGPEEFSAFSVPKSAAISFLADEEKDLVLFHFPSDGRHSNLKLPEMPLDVFAIDGVESVELFEITGAKRKRLQKTENFPLSQLTNVDEPQENMDISVKGTRHNLIMLEQVQNEWIYRWDGLDVGVGLSDLRYIPLNGEDSDLDEFIGDGGLVCDVILRDRSCDDLDVQYLDGGDSFAVLVER